MKHSLTKAPQDITCNSQETSNISRLTKRNKNSSAVLAKRQYYFDERMHEIDPTEI